jgi:transcriptional regulator with XRE-family HTH domain
MVKLKGAEIMAYNSILVGLIRNSGMNQNDLAKELGICYATVSNIITGRITPTKKHMKAIAAYFKKPPYKIFGIVKTEKKKKTKGAKNGLDSKRRKDV